MPQTQDQYGWPDLLDAGLEEVHLRAADEAGDEPVGRVVVELERRADLLDRAGVQHDDLVGHGHRLDLVVGDVDHRVAEVAVQLGDLDAHLHAQLGIEVRQRLVEQEDPRLAHDGAADGDALALAAGELPSACARAAARSAGSRAARCTRGSISAFVYAGGLEAEGEVLVDRHVRIERVGLEHHGDAALGRRHLVHALAVDQQLAAGDRLEPGDHAQQRRLAAARGADEDGELAGIDVEVDAVDDLDGRRSALSTFSRTTLVAMSQILSFTGLRPHRWHASRRISGCPARSASVTSAPRVGRMVDRGDEFERAARIGGGHRQRARPSEGVVEVRHLRREARGDRLSSRRAGRRSRLDLRRWRRGSSRDPCRANRARGRFRR